jgi:hypothetical protein
MNVLLLIDFSASVEDIDMRKFKSVYNYFHETLKIENLMTYGFDVDIFRIDELDFENFTRTNGTDFKKIYSMFSEKYFDTCVVCTDGDFEIPFGRFNHNILYIPDGSRSRSYLENIAWEVNFL